MVAPGCPSPVPPALRAPAGRPGSTLRIDSRIRAKDSFPVAQPIYPKPRFTISVATAAAAGRQLEKMAVLVCTYKKSYKLRYEWDERKSRRNRAKHGLSFDDAEDVFGGPTLTFEDDRVDYGEQRFTTLGLLAGRVVVIAHAERGAATRIISMRKANRREQETYQKRFGKD